MFIEQQCTKYINGDIGKLILRISTAGLMLFHGFHKYSVGIPDIKMLVVNAGLPEFVAYGSYLGELIIPCFLLLGLFTRMSALILAGNMVFAIALVHSGMLSSLNPQTGGLMIELPLLYFFPSLALFFLGGGKYSVDTQIMHCSCPFKEASN